MARFAIFLFLFYSVCNGFRLRDDCESLGVCLNSQSMKATLQSLELILPYPEFLQDTFKELKVLFDYLQGKVTLPDIIATLNELNDTCHEEKLFDDQIKNLEGNPQSPLLGAREDCPEVEGEDPMKDMLDAMEQMNTGKSTFDIDYYEKLHNCFDYIDPNLSLSQIEAWRGIVEYWERNGTGDDWWGSNNGNWHEDNITTTNLCDMTIFEPCNYASNVAYYHTVTEICSHHQNGGFFMDDSYVRALAQAFSMVGMGSSFMHGTNTDLGGQQDVTSNELFPYVQHQASLSSLENPSPILTDLQDQARTKTSIDIANEITTMYYDESVYDWYDHTDSFDMPLIEETYTAFFSTIMMLALEANDALCIIQTVTCTFGVPEDAVNFTLSSYIPELISNIEGLEVTPMDRVKLIGNTIGSVLKLLYAFIYQEDVLPISNTLTQYDAFNALGGCLLPRFNLRAGQIQTYPYYEGGFQLAEDIYPGDFYYCNRKIGHAKWHLESAIGILDLTYLADELYYLLSKVP